MSASTAKRGAVGLLDLGDERLEPVAASGHDGHGGAAAGQLVGGSLTDPAAKRR
jgi:hypothetical protein